MAPVAASASASTSEQPDLVRGNSDGNDSAAIPKKRGQSAGLLDDDSEAKEVKRERNRVHAQLSRSRKKAHMQQLEQEVAAYRAPLAACKEQDVTTQHCAHNWLQGVMPEPKAQLHSRGITTQQLPTQAAIKRDGTQSQQPERCLDTQWAVLDCFFQWLCSSESCTEQQWGTFAEQNCVLWLPVGSVQNTTATSEAAQQCRTLVRFTGAADILSYGRQHFFHAASHVQAATTAAAATAGVGAGATAAKSMPDVRLQVVVERREMYTQCIENMTRNTDSSTSCIGAPFMFKNASTRGGVVVGVAMCTFVTYASSSVQRLGSVNLIYDTCAMSTLLVAATTR
jgi:Basic region leucine zipper